MTAHKKSNFRQFKNSLLSSGFSLIEIMVAVSIVAILGAVAVPNLRNLSRQQAIDSASLQVLNTLKTAQSSAISRIKCPNNGVSDTWTVRLDDDEYSLIAGCQAGTVQTIFTRPYTSSQAGSAAEYSASSDVCPDAFVDVIFSRSQVSYLCEGSIVPDIETVNLSLTDSSGSITKTVIIESGGVIKSE